MKDREKKYRVLFLYFKYLQLAHRALNRSNENDILICWNFTTSIACGFLCKILNKKRIILALNIIAHNRKGIGETFRRMIFSPVMNKNSYFITVNSQQYIAEYSKRFNVKGDKFFVLNDPIQSNEIKEFDYNQSYIFVGGEAMRDWETLFKSCASIPQINFICIARKKNFNHSLLIPDNVKLFFDTDDKTFYDYMAKSSLVIIPLKSQLPSGLIILLRAALMQKPIIATNTPSINNYIKNKERGLLVEQGNSKDLTEKILILYNDVQLQKYLSSNLLNYVLANHSQENYSKRLLEIIQQITPRQNNNGTNKLSSM
jgi:glycosyltransferase involved in cell wall biosynthesis